jgi:hypothetical protein
MPVSKQKRTTAQAPLSTPEPSSPLLPDQHITLLLQLNLPRKPSFSQNVNHPNCPSEW